MGTHGSLKDYSLKEQLWKGFGADPTIASCEYMPITLNCAKIPRKEVEA